MKGEVINGWETFNEKFPMSLPPITEAEGSDASSSPPARTAKKKRGAGKTTSRGSKNAAGATPTTGRSSPVEKLTPALQKELNKNLANLKPGLNPVAYEKGFRLRVTKFSQK